MKEENESVDGGANADHVFVLRINADHVGMRRVL
jgi:hypothetical protein